MTGISPIALIRGLVVRQPKAEPTVVCMFRFSMAEFRFRWQSDGNFAGKVLVS
jgi:hypothetical protein